MNFTYSYEEYIKQLITNNKLESMTFSKEDSKEYILSKLDERASKKREIANICNTIICEYIETFEKDLSLMTKDETKALESFSNSLYPDGARSYEVNVCDYGIFYRIEKILAKYYKKIGDLNKYIYSLNRCSLGFLTLINGHSYHMYDNPNRDDALELIPKLDNNELSDVAKQKLLLTIVRDSITSEQSFSIENYSNILHILLAHMSKEPTRVEIINLTFHCNMFLQQFREYNIWAKDHGINVDTKQTRPLLYEAMSILKKYLFDGSDPDYEKEAQIDFLITKYFLNDVSISELLDALSKAQSEVSDGQNPMIQAKTLGMYNHYYLNIIYRFSDLPKDEIIKLSKDRISDVLPRLTNITRLVNNVFFNRYIVEFLNGASLTGSFDEFKDVILESTVYADKALFIHTVMVREMSKAIFDYMIDSTPEAFDGVCGYDTEYIKAHKDEMRELLSDCCMFHDIGKFFMIDIVENSMRHLTNDEFDLIKNHPTNFDNIIQKYDNTDKRFECIRDCALTHHLWHDGTGGYPKSIVQTKNRPFADILSVADSIDAATDFYGRPYNSGKSIDDLIKEFQIQAGTRYGKEVANALSIKKVRDKLEYLISEGRKDIYYRIYAFNKL